MKKGIGHLFVILTLVLHPWSALVAQDTIYVYGPGGPAPAIKEAAGYFEKLTGGNVIVTSGPTPQWSHEAKKKADIIYSGSLSMMTDFVHTFDGDIVDADVQPLYLRPLSLLVRPGNPKNIQGIRDILSPGVNILVVNGAGLVGAWEDMAGRKGGITTVRQVHRNIVHYAKNSAEAKNLWIKDSLIDVWIIWNIWQVSNPSLAEIVTIEPEYEIYRSVSAVITKKGKTTAYAKQFVDFLVSPEGETIFKKWGWTN